MTPTTPSETTLIFIAAALVIVQFILFVVSLWDYRTTPQNRRKKTIWIPIISGAIALFAIGLFISGLVSENTPTPTPVIKPHETHA